MRESSMFNTLCRLCATPTGREMFLRSGIISAMYGYHPCQHTTPYCLRFLRGRTLLSATLTWECWRPIHGANARGNVWQSVNHLWCRMLQASDMGKECVFVLAPFRNIDWSTARSTLWNVLLLLLQIARRIGCCRHDQLPLFWIFPQCVENSCQRGRPLRRFSLLCPCWCCACVSIVLHFLRYPLAMAGACCVFFIVLASICFPVVKEELKRRLNRLELSRAKNRGLSIQLWRDELEPRR